MISSVSPIASAASSVEASEHASIFFQPVKQEIPVRRRALEALVNKSHSAKNQRDRKALYVLKPIVAGELDAFEGEEKTRSPKTALWSTNTLRGSAAMPFAETPDDYEQARVYHSTALAHAPDPLSKNKSRVNIADTLRAAGRASEAEPYIDQADQDLPNTDWILVNKALVKHAVGKKDDANAIVRRLVASTDLSDPKSVLAAHARFEEDFILMDDLPAVRDLLARVTAAKQTE